ncbi:MAG: ATP synthase F1 subunit epsilon [Magnetococcales bacterium]|nr:ATP synthase F1 subunit epsilon [Magnetococcales bacterium]
METLQLEVVTPERLLLATEAKMVTIPGQDGLFGVMPGHTPFLSGVKAGLLVIGDIERGERYVVSRGFAQVHRNQVTVLVDQAVAEKDLSAKTATRDLEQARQALSGLAPEDPAHAACLEQVAFAEACLALTGSGKR